jgi:putative protease
LDYSCGKNSYALSLKDLSLIKDIPELQRIGVTSVKIEGRLKRPEYVAAAVLACRAALKGEEVDYEGLRAVFSRSGFTRGYFTGEHGDMQGVRDAEDAKLTADVLPKYAELMRAPNRRVPVTVTLTAESGKPIELKISDGTDEAVAYGDTPALADKQEAARDDVYAQLNRLGDTPFELTGAEINLSPGLFLPVSKLNALRREASDALLEKRIARRTRRYRVGETDGCKTPEPANGSKAPESMNRSNALEPTNGNNALEPTDRSIAPESANDNAIIKTRDTATPFLRVHCQNIAQLQAVLPYVSQAVIPAKLAQAAACSIASDTGLDKIIISPDRFITDETSLQAELTLLRSVGFTRLLCHNPAHIRLGKAAGFPFLHGAIGLNVFNAEAASFWQEQGLTDITASMELTLKESKVLTASCMANVANAATGAHAKTGIPVGLPAYGKLPLMLLRRCPFNRHCSSPANCPGFLTDRTNRAFPVLCHGDYHELLNADTLWLADKLNELNGFAFLSLFFHKESPQEARAVVNAYVQSGGVTRKTQTGIKHLSGTLSGGEPPRNFTRGLLFRGVE